MRPEVDGENSPRKGSPGSQTEKQEATERLNRGKIGSPTWYDLSEDEDQLGPLPDNWQPLVDKICDTMEARLSKGNIENVTTHIML
jgi:hypothetical protein